MIDLDKIADDLGLPRDKFRAGVQRIQREQEPVAFDRINKHDGHRTLGRNALIVGNIFDNAPLFAFPPSTPSAEIAYELGWRACAGWADRDDLHADVGSPAYTEERDKCLQPGGVTPSAAVKRDWVDCPVCGGTDMAKTTDAEGNSLINCVNHSCASNGGQNASSLSNATPSAVPDGWPADWRDELELIRAVLDGFQPCMARSDGLRAVRKLLAAAPTPKESER